MTPSSTEVVDQNSGDSVFQYSCCMLWRGLLHMVQTNAERYNNGEQLISDWRLDMVDFCKISVRYQWIVACENSE